jgi:hypothetical protein
VHPSACSRELDSSLNKFEGACVFWIWLFASVIVLAAVGSLMYLVLDFIRWLKLNDNV